MEEDIECSRVSVSGGKIIGNKAFLRQDNKWSNPTTGEKFNSTDEIREHYAEKGKRKVLVQCEI